MDLVVLDASAVGGGPVSRAAECAAAEVRRTGVAVTTLRLYSLYSAVCAECHACQGTARCARRHRALEDAAVLLAGADMLIVGVSSSASQRDPRTEALLRRLVGAFGEVYDRRHGESEHADGGRLKRAALISSAPPLLGIAALLGTLPYGLAGVWRVLDRADVDVVGTTSVARRWSGPAAWDITRERATRLGRVLAARPAARPVLVPARTTVAPSARVRVA